jgi:gamma-butyrobetaine dioxygenase
MSMKSGDAAVRRLDWNPRGVSIEWERGERADFTSIWLRDNRRGDRDARNGQRLIDVTQLPVEPRLRSAVIEGSTLVVAWQGEAEPATFDLGWLAAQAAGPGRERVELAPKPWLDGAKLDARKDFAWLSLAEARESRAARHEWLVRLLQDGLAFFREVPATDSAIVEAVALIGRIAETNYGLVFDVRSVPQPENLAYSDLGLGLHTDNPYRDPVPGFQALHALIASPDGGESLFADGFALAEHLRRQDPSAFALLSTTPVSFLYRSQDAELYAERPLIATSCNGRVTAVHYNNRSIAPLRLDAGSEEFYGAYRSFAELLLERSYQLRLLMQGGELAVFDNQRILHGRTAFSSARHARHLRGCYLTRDSVCSEAAQLRRALAGEFR